MRTGRTSMYRRRMLAVVVGAVLLLGACSDSPSETVGEPDMSQLSDAIAYRESNPTLTITNLSDGARVSSPFIVEVAVEGITLAPAGSAQDGVGHWHLLVDQGCATPGDPIPDDDRSIHVGSGEDNLLVDLPPGSHELCAQIGDGFHVAVAITETINVEVLP